MSERLEVREPAPLLAFLRARLPGWSRRTLEQRLRFGGVLVNGEEVSRPDRALCAGDVVAVLGHGERAGLPPARLPPPAGIELLHLDSELVAVDKPAGLLSVSTEREKERTALALLRAWLSRPGRPERLWPVHRLDRETSGVLLFARSRAACDALRASWPAARKLYLAVVEGRPRAAEGLVDQPLWSDGARLVHVAAHPEAKQARTRYRVLREGPARTLLEVELETGRRQQIRAHLAWLGHPVVGDPLRGGGPTRLGLHAWRLVLPDPRIRLGQAQVLELEARVPAALEALLAARSGT